METPESKAEAVAREQFLRDQPKADLRNFNVFIEDNGGVQPTHPKVGNTYRVTFAPKLAKGEPLVPYAFGVRQK
jgi:hypothetical protein